MLVRALEEVAALASLLEDNCCAHALRLLFVALYAVFNVILARLASARAYSKFMLIVSSLLLSISILFAGMSLRCCSAISVCSSVVPMMSSE